MSTVNDREILSKSKFIEAVLMRQDVNQARESGMDLKKMEKFSVIIRGSKNEIVDKKGGKDRTEQFIFPLSTGKELRVLSFFHGFFIFEPLLILRCFSSSAYWF